MRRHRLAVWGILLSVLSAPGLAAAADAPSRSALDIVPADAAFFASWSRQEEQFDILRESRAFAQFLEIPRVRETLGPILLGEFDLENPNHVIMKQWLSQPFVQAGLDSLSHEVFVYGDASFTQAVNCANQMMWSGSLDRLEALADGKTGHEARQVADAAAIRRLQDLHVPNLVFGFKPKDAMRARVQLMLLDGLIHIVLARKDVPPQFRKQYGRETIQGQQFLTFTVTGAMILDQIEFANQTEIQPQTLAEFIRTFRQRKIVVAVGFLNGYVVLSVGSTTEHLQHLGQEEPLAGQPDMARVIRLGDKPCTSIRYVASDFRTALNSYSGYQPDFGKLFEQSLADGQQVSDETRAKAELALQEAKAERKRQKKREPRTASLAYAYLTDTGYEGFSYDEAEAHPAPTRPMSVLLHTGADPIGVFAYRHWVDTLEDYDRLSERGAKLLNQLEDWFNIDGEESRVTREEFRFLAGQFDAIMRQQVVPALTGGQAAFVISASERSRQWHPEMPVSETPLPLPELALVVETKDPAALLAGLDEAYRVVRAAIELVSGTAQEIPPLEPEIDDTALGRLYFLPMWPELTRIDPNLLAPTVGFSNHWLVATLRPKTATTLLGPTGWIPPEIDPEGLSDLTALKHVRPERFTQIALDWLGYAEQTLMEDPSEDDAALLAIYRSALQLVGCWKSYTRSICRDGEVRVTHSVWRFEDRP